MLNNNLETKKKSNRTRYVIGYITPCLSRDWRGNDLFIEMKGGKSTKYEKRYF